MVGDGVVVLIADDYGESQYFYQKFVRQGVFALDMFDDCFSPYQDQGYL